MRFKLDAEGWGGLVLSTRHLFRSIKPNTFRIVEIKMAQRLVARKSI